MKKTALALALVLSILVMFGVQFVKLVEANGWFIFRTSDGPPKITIKSPLNNEVASFNTVVFAFTLTRPSHNWTLEGTNNRVVSANVILDGTVYRKVDVNSELSVPFNYFGVNSEISVPFNYSLNLTDLEDGAHTIQLNILCKGASIMEWTFGTVPSEIDYHVSSDIINFTVDTIPPEISINSIENKTYYASDLQLNFAVSENFCNASYVLDGENVPVAENLTLSDLPFGSHILTVYAYDRAGNMGVSHTIAFAVEPFPTSLVIASVSVLAVIIVIGLNIFFKKRRRNGL